ncbi:hypothetical protein QQ045_007104 [Rhodiola kirilowii]
MEHNFAPYDMEYMKMAMLKHEEIFKQQVYELHRLYRIQKLLMRTTSQRKISKNEHPKGTKHMRNLLLDLERPSDHDCFNKQPRMLDDHFDQDEEAIDLTLGLGTTCYNNSQKMNSKVSANRLLTSNSVTSFSSSSSASSSRHSKNGRKYNYQGKVRQQDVAMLEQPPWILQVLSLNMT